MVKYWLLSYPRTNMEISIRESVIGGKNTSGYERLYKSRIEKGDKIVLYISGDGKIKGHAVAGDYFYDESELWPPQNGEVWPHRRIIDIKQIYDYNEEKDITNYYSRLNILKQARENNMVIGKVFGNFIRGLTPKEISENDFLVLSNQSAVARALVSYKCPNGVLIYPKGECEDTHIPIEVESEEYTIHARAQCVSFLSLARAHPFQDHHYSSMRSISQMN